MIVLNSVTSDARVLKEANTLAGAGYRVTIIGIADGRDGRPINTLESGVMIVRLHPSQRSLALRLLVGAGRAHRRYAAAAVLAALVLLRHELLASVAGVLLLAVVAAALPLVAVIRTRRWLRSWCLRVPGATRLAGFLRPVLIGLGTVVGLWAFRRWWRAAYNRVWHHLFITRPVLHELAKARPEVVHCHDVRTLPMGCAYKRRHACHVVYDSHEVAEHQQSLEPSEQVLTITLQRRLSKDVSGFITVNDRIAEYLNAAYPDLPRATVLPNATLPAAGPCHDDGRLRRAAGLPQGMKILLFQGGFARGRGLLTLIRALPLLPDDWAIVLMGWGSMKEQLLTECGALPRHRDAVRFVPPAAHEELRLWTAGATLGIIPYQNTCLNHWFCSPNKLWEYPNAGVPILVSAFPVMRQMAETHGIGWLLDDPNDPASIARAVSSISNADLETKRRNCHVFVAQHNWSHYKGRLLGLYAGLRPAPEHRDEAGAQAA